MQNSMVWENLRAVFSVQSECNEIEQTKNDKHELDNMMSTLVVGDMHAKEEAILKRVDVAIEKLGISEVVFLGDYFDEWHASDKLMLQAINELEHWARTKREQGVTLQFLLGNHDMSYLRHEVGAGTHQNLFTEVCSTLEFLEVKIAAVMGSYLLTHAGITNAWARKFLGNTLNTNFKEAPQHSCISPEIIASELNAMLKSGSKDKLDALYTAGAERGGFGLPGPLWAGKQELSKDAIYGLNQIVGHTPVPTISSAVVPAKGEDKNALSGLSKFKNKVSTQLNIQHKHEIASESKHNSNTNEKLFFCDTFSLTSNMYAIGDGSMLLINGNETSILTSESLDLDDWELTAINWSNGHIVHL